MPIRTQAAATETLIQVQFDAVNWNSRLSFYDNRIMLFLQVLTPDNRIVGGGENVDYFFQQRRGTQQ